MSIRKPWEYSGDVNIEYGGEYIYLCRKTWESDFGVPCVRVCPLSDCGGKENHFHVIAGDIIRPRYENLQGILKTCGFWLDDWGNICGGYGVVFTPDSDYYFRILVDSCMRHNGVESACSVIVAIGKDCRHDSGKVIEEPDIRLRGNTDLRKWVERNYIKGRP